VIALVDRELAKTASPRQWGRVQPEFAAHKVEDAHGLLRLLAAPLVLSFDGLGHASFLSSRNLADLRPEH
jgi:hypothetical protein